MTRKVLLGIFVFVFVFIFLFAYVGIDLFSKRTFEPDVFVGVDVGFGDEKDVYRVADAVSGFANLIIIGSLDVTENTPALIRVCNYLYQRDFSFIVYVGFGNGTPRGPDQIFFNTTVKQWGDKFLGVYMFDEIGGKQLDYPLELADKPVKLAANYSDAAQQFVHVLNGALTDFTGPAYYSVPNITVFTSDYGLYWFDYLFGYNTVFGEFVGNQSRQLSIALTRGAANAQHQNWGVMITWKYDQAPFLEDACQLYNDMVLAYENDAKYIVVFNSPDNQSATTELGILTQDHIGAMKQFWDYASTHAHPSGDIAELAYVLPRDYGFGFRNENDNIWGIWQADALSAMIWKDTNNLIATYGMKLDIVYETLSDDIPIRLMYDKLIFWNGTTIG